MSTILVDNLTGKTSAGDITVTSEGGAATMQLQQGLVKLWCLYNQVTPSVSDSLLVSSVTDVSAGYATVNFSSAFSTANISVVQGSYSWNKYHEPATTTSVTQGFSSSSFTLIDVAQEDTQICGDLA